MRSIDDLELASPSLLPGAHAWAIRATDPVGTIRAAIQTWTFNLL